MYFRDKVQDNADVDVILCAFLLEYMEHLAV